MKTLMVITINSFVDLITNSSSELFICNGNKTLEAIEELLLELAKTNNEITNGNIPTDKTFFDSVCCRPEFAKFTFHFFKFPQNLLDEYRKYHDLHSEFEKVWCSDDARNYQNSTRYLLLSGLEEKARKELKIDENLYKTNKKEYDRLHEILFEKRNEIWKEWYKDTFLSKMALFKWFLTDNGFSQEDIVKVENIVNEAINLGSRYIHLNIPESPENANLIEAYEAFQLYESYGIGVDEGDVLINSISDNSIDYELMNSIENLGATRYHLG